MNRNILIATLLIILLSSSLHSQQLSLIPYPKQVWVDNGVFITADSGAIPPAQLIRKLTAVYDTALGNEGYRLKISSRQVQITANTLQGQYYAGVTIKQLVEYDSMNRQYYLPCVEIEDQPKYQWRGMHLDVSRHFFGKEVIKQYLDRMAALKLNIFHWHLTDDQGWRIEINKYPLLTETGAWRTEKDGSRYGGYYTQQDIKEIVAYAAQRFITIVPEIEIPGHSSAAIAAYPALSCTPAEAKSIPHTWGIKKDIYCPNEFTFRFLYDVLDEVCALFPGKYIHLGGDEAPKKAWKNSPVAQQLIKEQHLQNEQQLQHYIMQKMEAHIATKGKRAIGWGEILKGGVTDSMIVMSWIDKHAGIRAAQLGNQVIMTPRFFCYFDYPQKLSDKRPAWWMTYISLRKAYRFTPTSPQLSKQQNARISGGQANVWTEHISTEAQLYHHILPRLAATAEALWTGGRNYEAFSKRLQHVE